MSSEIESAPLKKLKILLIGGTFAGKTSLINSFTNNTSGNGGPSTHSGFYPPLIGMDFISKNISFKGHEFRIQLWDTTGNQRFENFLPTYIRHVENVDGIVFVYDIGCDRTFGRILELFESVKAASAYDSAIKILVGNKSTFERKVTVEAGEERAQEIGNAIFLETNAKEGYNVNEMVHRIISSKFSIDINLDSSNSNSTRDAVCCVVC